MMYHSMEGKNWLFNVIFDLDKIAATVRMAITPNLLTNLMRSMPTRLQQIIDRRGYHSDY